MSFPKRVVIFLLIIQFYLFFAESLQTFGQYRFDTWTTDNGLPQNGVRSITQTPDGYLWFTTFDGLVRFDGISFTTFSKGDKKGIINNRFTGLYADTDGTLYATTMEDGVMTTYKDGTFTSYNSEQVPERYVKFIKRDETGELAFWVDTGDHLTETWYYLRDEKFVFKEKIAKTDVVTKHQGKSGKIWTLTAKEIIENDNGKRTVYPYQVKFMDSTAKGFEDREGGFWVEGYELIRLKDGKIERIETKNLFPPKTEFHSFWEESDGSLWFVNGGPSAPGAGLVRYQNGQFSVFGKEAGLSDTSIFNVFKDREGTVWVATNKGLNRLRKSVITTYSRKEGLRGAEIYPIYQDREGDIWVGTTKGLNRYRNGKFEDVNFTQTGEIFSNIAVWKNDQVSIQSLLKDKNGKLWIGTAGAIYLAQNGKVEMLKISEGHHVHSLLEDKNGTIWAATGKGILRFDNYQITKFYTVKDGLPNDFMNLVFEDQHGNLWFGGFGGLTEFKDGKFINYTTKYGLGGNYVRSIKEDADGTFWIGTYDEGLSRFKDGKFVNIKAENGLYNNGVFAIQEDVSGNFWISSNKGIYRVKRQELNDFADGKIHKINSVGYGIQDGMLSTECNGGRQPASIRDKDGKFWFPTQDGVVVVEPKNETYNTLPPTVIIESMSVEREPVKIGENMTFEPHQKNIEINFTAISLIKSEQIKFKYKLEGHDADWIDAGTRRTAYYSHLPHGKYRFLVKAANSDGIWNETGASLDLHLRPFFYQTKLFVMLCVFSGAVLLLIVWKISVYQLQARERKLAKLVSERTEELKKANEELKYLANSDGLTKIGNRRRFEEFLADEWHRAVRFKTEISLILLDIDHFKLYNDTYGHQAGDDCLQKVAEAFAETIKRPTDLVARFGGEEFAIILGGTDAQGAQNIAEQAAENVRNLKIPHSKSKTGEYLTVSIGIATTFAKFEITESDLIKVADKALYQAKANGRNQIVSFDFLTQKTSVLEEKFVGKI